MKTHLLAGAAAVAFGALGLTSSANAVTILTMGQSQGAGSPITATENAAHTQTTITGTTVPVTISQILSGATPPVSANLTLNATSTAAATLAGANITQMYSGSFSITSGANNYLSGTFVDALFGSGTSLTLQAATGGTETVNFTSNVIPAADLAQPDALAFGFANVLPPVSIVGTSLAGFTSSVAGTFSSSVTPSVPEPTSLALLGAGLAGLGLFRARRRKTD